MCIAVSELSDHFQHPSVQELAKTHLEDNPFPYDWDKLFEVPFSWKLDKLPGRLVDWLSHGPQIITFMAVLNSTQFRKLVSPHTDERARTALKVFLSSSFVLRVQDRFPEYTDGSNRELLQLVRNTAGNQILTWLDRDLKSFRVDVSSEQKEVKWQVFFLILIATMLSICFVSDKVLTHSLNPNQVRPDSFTGER
jgi:hypothetical protein